jgi:hypothetical protein
MQIIEVGQPFEPGTISYQEVTQYSCRSGRHFLVLPMANISQLELKAVTEGNAYFAFTVIGDVLRHFCGQKGKNGRTQLP